MKRESYKLFSPFQIGYLNLSNRLVRSATWDPMILERRQMDEDTLDIYRALARGGVGLIISGALAVYRHRLPNTEPVGKEIFDYGDLSVNDFYKLADVVHAARPDCRIVAQLECGLLNTVPSEHVSLFTHQSVPAMQLDEIERIIENFVVAIADMQAAGFDGVQLHASHGGLLSAFLSPYSNQRQDEYGGTLEHRVRIVREIVTRARMKVGRFPILIKINGTDFLEGGIDLQTFPALALAIEGCGVDAIEISGGMWECLARPERELGFFPAPSPESHTRLKSPEKQSYFLPYAEAVKLTVPVILVGGNRDVERLEEIVQGGRVDLIALCRPLICEPDLPNRWRDRRGGRLAKCISCNTCLYEMYIHPGQDGSQPVVCLKDQQQKVKEAQRWLKGWVKENIT